VGRRINNPEEYLTPQEAAQQLRDLAASMEQSDGSRLVKWYLNLSYAFRDEVEAALQKKARKEAGRG